jgi:signal transduction histidine kinase
MIANNLINNACKYSHENTISYINSYYISPQDTTQRKGIYRIVVTSFGSPLSLDDCEKIFDMGHRTDEAQRIGLGMGIGLFLVRCFAQLHGGRAYVKSTKICDYHVPYLYSLNVQSRDFSNFFSEDELSMYRKAYRELKLERHNRLIYRGEKFENPRYIKQFINSPTACNEFIVEFPQTEGGR